MDNSLDVSLIQIIDKVADWQEAIKVSAAPLLECGYIEPGYVDGMIDTVNEFGAYIVIAPDIAMPHYHGDKGGALKSGFGLTRLSKPVYFEEGNEASKARIIIPLACFDNDEHIKIMSSIAMILSEQKNIEAIIAAKTVEEISAVFV
jgi:ascorbate PTS system EIIA or EIIAB component